MRFIPSVLAMVLIFGGISLPSHSQEAPALIRLENLAIPESLGKIDEISPGTSDHWLILIQDIHAHFIAQENIAAIVDHLNAVYGIKAVGVEGGWWESSMKEAWELPSSPEKQLLARGLLEEAYINGPAYAALFSQMPTLLVGVEDRALYLENRSVYLEHLDGRETLAEKFAQKENELRAVKHQVFNPDLKNFDSALDDFRRSKDMGKFLPVLLLTAKSRQLTLADLRQITLFEEAWAMEKTLDKEKLKRESGRLMTDFKNRRLSLEELLNNQIIPEEKLAYYPEVRAYRDLLALQKKISFSEFSSQLEEAIHRVQETLFVSQAEREANARWDRSVIAKKILLFEASPETLREYESQKEGLLEDIEAWGFSEAFKLGLRFYDLAVRRDRVFYSKISENPALSRGNSVLVAGGFHTEGLREELKKHGVSYIVITPDLAKTGPDESLYFKRLRDPVPETQALAQPALFLLPEFPGTFAGEALKMRSTRDRTAGVRAVALAITGAGRAPRKALPPSIAPEELKNRSPEERLEWLRETLREPASGTPRMFLAVESRMLEKLLRDESTRRVWDIIRGERMNTVILAYENLSEIPMDAIGGRFRVERIEGARLGELSAGIPFKTRFRGPLEEEVIAAVLEDGADRGDERILRLIPHPASLLLFRAFLAKPDLRALASNQEFLDTINEILLTIKNLEAFLRAA